MNHKLYIIEGLPCSGKSTASAFVAELLKDGHNVCYIDEGMRFQGELSVGSAATSSNGKPTPAELHGLAKRICSISRNVP